MNVTLPNGVVIRGVPDGTTKEQVKAKAIASGLATEADFGPSSSVANLSPAEAIPLDGGEPDIPAGPKDRGIGETLAGLGEAALTTATGATTGAFGYLGGAVRGIAEQVAGNVDSEGARRMAEEGAAMLTYAPRTQAGQEYVAEVADIAGQLPAVMPTLPALQGTGRAAAQTAQLARPAAAEAVTAVRSTVTPQAQQSVRSMGAAEVPPEQVRRNKAQELPIPIPLTKGQATQDFAQQRFERETAKSPDDGGLLRERFTEQNQLINQNIDEMLNLTETQLPETAYRVQTGNKVIEALQKSYDNDKKKVSNAYNVARQRGETQQVIDVNNVSAYLNENRDIRDTAPIIKRFADSAFVREVGEGSIEDGNFRLKPMTIERAEDLRQRVNQLVDQTNPQDIRQASQIKRLIDEAQDSQGSGQAFKSARKQRQQLANKYENLAIIDQLLDTKGRYNDKRIAAENVVNKAVLSGSVEDVRNLRKALTTGGEDGIQAWKEVRAATLRHLRDEATKNVGRDPLGNPLVSAAQMDRVLRSLDKDGKLEIVFGKTGAEQLRTLNDVTKDIFVAQPNAVNSSNTASVVLAALDAMTAAGTGIPAPLLSGLKYTRDKAKAAKIKKKVDEALKNDAN